MFLAFKIDSEKRNFDIFYHAFSKNCKQKFKIHGVISNRKNEIFTIFRKFAGEIIEISFFWVNFERLKHDGKIFRKF